MEAARCFHFIAKEIHESEYVQEPRSFDINQLESPDKTMEKVKNILRWWCRKTKNKYIQKFLILWDGDPLEGAMWEPEHNFPIKEASHDDLESGRIAEDK